MKSWNRALSVFFCVLAVAILLGCRLNPFERHDDGEDVSPVAVVETPFTMAVSVSGLEAGITFTAALQASPAAALQASPPLEVPVSPPADLPAGATRAALAIPLSSLGFWILGT
ncbi:MAG: hypothetical protein GX442_06570 [Candidatus Riflebacteria bacterium]|nr:hypothetical protein [Candidatus Riflebacteria bacterium]